MLVAGVLAAGACCAGIAIGKASIISVKTQQRTKPIHFIEFSGANESSFTLLIRVFYWDLSPV